MRKYAFVLLLAVATVSCIPIEPTSSNSGLVRPSPINPDVVSDPKPVEDSSNFSDFPKSTATPSASSVQKIPARGTKLSLELDEHKSNITPTPDTKHKRDTHISDAPAKPSFKRDQPTSSSTSTPKRLTTTTAGPVSLKTPIVHASGAKTKRSADESVGNRTSTTRAPITSNNNDDDGSGPHFIRPVPVEQILKNIHEAPKHHQPSPIVLHHEENNEATTTEGSAKSTGDNEHKFNHKSTTKKQESNVEEEEDHDEHGDDDSSSSEDKGDRQ